jgi:Sap, sulfolipid-1-addressing protein
VSLAEVLPLAFVMIAGPQIVTSFFLATSVRWAANSTAYIMGAAISVTMVVTIAYFAARGTKSVAGAHKTTLDGIEAVVLLLLLFLIVRVYVTRGKSAEPPRWMRRLEKAKPNFALGLGLVLLGVFPTDLASSISVGLHVARGGDPWWHCLPFVALTLFLLAVPALCVVLLGTRAAVVLPKTRDWMNENAWVISELVLLFFAALTIHSLVRG